MAVLTSEYAGGTANAMAVNCMVVFFHTLSVLFCFGRKQNRTEQNILAFLLVASFVQKGLGWCVHGAAGGGGRGGPAPTALRKGCSTVAAMANVWDRAQPAWERKRGESVSWRRCVCSAICSFSLLVSHISVSERLIRHARTPSHLCRSVQLCSVMDIRENRVR